MASSGTGMHIFVITLNDALARQQRAISQLQAQGLVFRFVPAIPGQEAIRAPACTVRKREFLLATGRNVTPGEVGCFLSHRLLWTLCAQIGEPILIMEDDFELSADFSAALSCLENEIGEYGFIRLQSERRARKKRVKSLGRFTLWRYTKAPNSAMCYGITPSAARRLLADAAEIDAPVDVYMKRFWKHGQRMYAITPYTVTESKLSEATQIAGRSKARKSLPTRLHRLLARVGHCFSRAHYNFIFSWRAADVAFARPRGLKKPDQPE